MFGARTALSFSSGITGDQTMSISWKASAIALALLASTGYAVAQMAPGGSGPMQECHQMMQKMMHQHMEGMGEHGMMHAGQPSMAGQSAFGAIQEIVRILEADANTDWSKVNISALREHLIDMNEIALKAIANERKLDNGLEIAVTGDGRTLEGIKRMVPAHAREFSKTGWNVTAEDLPDGVKLIATSDDAQQVLKIKALGFMGIMVQGAHHQQHHLAMAKGEFGLH
jgi:hypothetical protein